MSTTFVSCIFSNEVDVVEPLFKKWSDLGVYIKFYILDDLMFDTVKHWNYTEEHVHIELLQDIRYESWAENIDLDTCILPTNRNESKDTIPQIWNTLHKVPCMGRCAHENPFNTHYFAYIDFNAFDLFQDPRTVRFLQEHHAFNKGSKRLFSDKIDQLYIPGCWGMLEESFVKSSQYKHTINWRFCGAFVFGSIKSVIDFYKHYQDYFETYISQYDNCLSWEVNYWAWLESTLIGTWTPIWYSGNHNDTMVRVPNICGYHILKNSPEYYNEYRYLYPNLSPYRPMSASVTLYKDKYILNTRYVNYWIYDNGAYWYPDDEHKIRTKNVCSLLKHGSYHHNVLYPTCYKEVVDRFQPPVMKRANVFSEGVEDLRLYNSSNGKLMFIGSTLGYSYTDKIRMIVGQYEINTEKIEKDNHYTGKTNIETVVHSAYLCNAKIVTSPYDNWCEKNWCPIPLNDGQDGFVYKWHPLEIGVLKDGNNGCYELDIKHVIPTNTEIFGKIKGSTPFKLVGDNELFGLIHYSEELNPRQYYNRIVVLDNTTYVIKRCTESFCFESVGIEFCMGMEIMIDKYIFWISQKDRDPLMIEMHTRFFDDKWISV